MVVAPGAGWCQRSSQCRHQELFSKTLNFLWPGLRQIATPRAFFACLYLHTKLLQLTDIECPMIRNPNLLNYGYEKVDIVYEINVQVPARPQVWTMYKRLTRPSNGLRQAPKHKAKISTTVGVPKPKTCVLIRHTHRAILIVQLNKISREPSSTLYSCHDLRVLGAGDQEEL